MGDLRDRPLAEPVEEERIRRQAADRRAVGQRERDRPIDAERGEGHHDDRKFDHLRHQSIHQPAGDADEQSARDRGRKRIPLPQDKRRRHAGETEDRAHRNVDLAGHQDESDSDRQEAEEGYVLKDAGQVADRHEIRAA